MKSTKFFSCLVVAFALMTASSLTAQDVTRPSTGGTSGAGGPTVTGGAGSTGTGGAKDPGATAMDNGSSNTASGFTTNSKGVKIVISNGKTKAAIRYTVTYDAGAAGKKTESGVINTNRKGLKGQKCIITGARKNTVTYEAVDPATRVLIVGVDECK